MECNRINRPFGARKSRTSRARIGPLEAYHKRRGIFYFLYYSKYSEAPVAPIYVKYVGLNCRGNLGKQQVLGISEDAGGNGA